MVDGTDFPKQDGKSVGVSRQYCGRLGKVAYCQVGTFLAYVSPLGGALVDKRLYLPESWTSDQERCVAAGVPAERRGYRTKAELALERGHLQTVIRPVAHDCSATAVRFANALDKSDDFGLAYCHRQCFPRACRRENPWQPWA